MQRNEEMKNANMKKSLPEDYQSKFLKWYFKILLLYVKSKPCKWSIIRAMSSAKGLLLQ